MSKGTPAFFVGLMFCGVFIATARVTFPAYYPHTCMCVGTVICAYWFALSILNDAQNKNK